MNIKKILTGLCSGLTLAATVFSTSSFAGIPYDMKNPDMDCMWFNDPTLDIPVDQKPLYWYEKGVRQGTYDDPNGVMGDGTVRGREIFDARSNAWYWLDSVYEGAKATNKEVWMPYIYQDEADWMNDEARLNEIAAESDKASGTIGMADCVIRQIKAHGTREGGKWVRYDKDGKMIKGWYTEDGSINPEQTGNTYFYDQQTGLMAKGDVTIGGVKYHFDEVTGVCDSSESSKAFDVIKNSPGNYAIEAVVDLSGYGNGYHAKLAISNGGAATFSWGIQYDVNSGQDHARGKCALMVESATPAAQSYFWPQNLIVGTSDAAASDVKLMLSVDGKTGTAYCYLGDQLVGQYTNPGLIVSDPVNVQIKTEGAADDGSAVVAKFKNVKIKYPYYTKSRIMYKGIPWYGSFNDGIGVFESHYDPAVGTDAYGNPDGYEMSWITGTNSTRDWDVPSGVQTYITYTRGFEACPFADGYIEY